jgi:hypothetical protein
VSLGNNVSSINDAGAFLTGHEADFAQDMQQPEGVTGGNGTLQAVPEPGALSVLGLGMLGALRRRRRNA